MLSFTKQETKMFPENWLFYILWLFSKFLQVEVWVVISP